MVTKSADAFRTISEVAEWLGVQTHVLRFWESKFSQVKPVKRAGGRRYYRPSDMLLLGGIRKLLHEDGMTIKGVQKILREEGMAHVADMSPPLDEVTAAQVDGDLVAGDGAVEAEMAPVDTGVAGVAAEPQDVAPEPEEEIETIDMFADPVDAAPAEDAADAHPDADVEDAPEEPPAESTPAALPTFMRAPADDQPAPEAEDVATDTPASEPADDTPVAGIPGGLPSFMAPPAAKTDEAEAAPEPEPEPEPVPEAAPEPMQAEAPKPRIIDVPDDPDPALLDVKPSALGMSAQANALTPAQRDAIAPLVAELSALRDRMASARRDSR